MQKNSVFVHTQCNDLKDVTTLSTVFYPGCGFSISCSVRGALQMQMANFFFKTHCLYIHKLVVKIFADIWTCWKNHCSCEKELCCVCTITTYFAVWVVVCMEDNCAFAVFIVVCKGLKTAAKYCCGCETLISSLYGFEQLWDYWSSL